MDTIISVFNSDVFLNVSLAVLSGLTSWVLDKLNIDVAKPFKILIKAMTTPFTTSIRNIIAFTLKYFLPALSIALLMRRDHLVDKYFVFSMCICFTVLIISIIRDALLNFTLKTLDAIESDRAERMQKASEEIRRHDKR